LPVFCGNMAEGHCRFFHPRPFPATTNRAFKVRPGEAFSEVLGNSTLDVKKKLFLLLRGRRRPGHAEAPPSAGNP